jgi:hypothetical protein
MDGIDPRAEAHDTPFLPKRVDPPLDVVSIRTGRDFQNLGLGSGEGLHSNGLAAEGSHQRFRGEGDAGGPLDHPIPFLRLDALSDVSRNVVVDEVIALRVNEDAVLLFGRVSIVVAEVEPDRIAPRRVGDKDSHLLVVPNAIVQDEAETLPRIVLAKHRDAMISVVVDVILAYEVVAVALPLAEMNPITAVVMDSVPLDDAVPHLTEPDARSSIPVDLILLDEEVRDEVLSMDPRSCVVTSKATFE